MIQARNWGHELCSEVSFKDFQVLMNWASKAMKNYPCNLTRALSLLSEHLSVLLLFNIYAKALCTLIVSGSAPKLKADLVLTSTSAEGNGTKTPGHRLVSLFCNRSEPSCSEAAPMRWLYRCPDPFAHHFSNPGHAQSQVGWGLRNLV